jgi:hypothetical protein
VLLPLPNTPGRVSWVVLPLLFGAVSLNYLDRTALSFASLQLNADLELSTQQYGLAAATFALGEGKARQHNQQGCVSPVSSVQGSDRALHLVLASHELSGKVLRSS